MRFSFNSCVLAVSLAIVGQATAGTIYNDSFSRSGGLNGTHPDVVDTPNQPWNANTSIVTNGSVATLTPDIEGYLPLTLSDAATYTVSATIAPETNGSDSSDWLALGFTSAMGTNGAGNYFGGSTVANPQAWIIYRESGGPNSFYGGGTNNPGSGTSATGGTPDTFSISINTVTGGLIFSDSLGLFVGDTGTLTSGEIASVTGIGIGAFKTASGNFDDVIVTESPEPASLGLVAVGTLALLARRRRSCLARHSRE